MKLTERLAGKLATRESLNVKLDAEIAALKTLLQNLDPAVEAILIESVQEQVAAVADTVQLAQVAPAPAPEFVTALVQEMAGDSEEMVGDYPEEGGGQEGAD